jgi:hypothetical protein
MLAPALRGKHVSGLRPALSLNSTGLCCVWEGPRRPLVGMLAPKRCKHGTVVGAIAACANLNNAKILRFSGVEIRWRLLQADVDAGAVGGEALFGGEESDAGGVVC